MKDIIKIKNIFDNSELIWFNNDFTKNNLPGPEFQKLQKKSTLPYILEKGKGVLDIGAHIGDYSIPLASALQNLGRKDIIIYAIEPTKAKCEFMTNIVKLNNLNNIKIINIGISNSERKHKISKYSEKSNGRNTGGHQWIEDNNGINFTTLDSLMEKNEIGEIGFFWLDAQWMEYEVLSGGINFLKKNKPYILMEYYPPTVFEEDNITVKFSRRGTKRLLLKDKKFKFLFTELKMKIVPKKEFEDLFLTF